MSETYYRDDNGDLLTRSEVEERFQGLLDEVHEELKIGELSWAPSVALERLDPIAYRCYLSDYSSKFEEVDGDEMEEED